LWEEYSAVQESFPDRFAMQQLSDASEIYPVFRKLFEPKTA
ncbi:MAG: DUF444 family protein, partial [Anaerolineae bacterium]|nr:DUF444 family protein [Anaerolineae bacterium]